MSESTPANETAGSRPRLLIADDDPSVVSVLATTLVVADTLRDSIRVHADEPSAAS